VTASAPVETTAASRNGSGIERGGGAARVETAFALRRTASPNPRVAREPQRTEHDAATDGQPRQHVDEVVNLDDDPRGRDGDGGATRTAAEPSLTGPRPIVHER